MSCSVYQDDFTVTHSHYSPTRAITHTKQTKKPNPKTTSRYPTEDEYSKFVADHGGSTNAYTAGESTNYHFEVNADALEPALDR